jgi:hypothetical protein
MGKRKTRDFVEAPGKSTPKEEEWRRRFEF